MNQNLPIWEKIISSKLEGELFPPSLAEIFAPFQADLDLNHPRLAYLNCIESRLNSSELPLDLYNYCVSELDSPNYIDDSKIQLASLLKLASSDVWDSPNPEAALAAVRSELEFPLISAIHKNLLILSEKLQFLDTNEHN